MNKPLRLACAGLMSVALVGGALSPAGAAEPRIEGLNGPRGLDIGRQGKMIVSESDGTISRVIRKTRQAPRLRTVGKVPAEFNAPAVAVGRDGRVWVLTVGGEKRTSGSLFLMRPGKSRRLVADMMANARRNPDPYDVFVPNPQNPDEDVEGPPNESNPYGVAAGPRGTALVADAANNSVWKVAPGGKVRLVARVKPRMIPSMEDPSTMMPTEAVTTSVTMGSDGAVFISELRGFPGTPGYSQVWRVRPGAMGVVCDPERPRKRSCSRYADGLTSVVGLDAGRRGTLYASELSKAGWPAAETGEPGTDIGAVKQVRKNGSTRELTPRRGQIRLPGDVAVGITGNVYVPTPIFGPGGILQVR